MSSQLTLLNASSSRKPEEIKLKDIEVLVDNKEQPWFKWGCVVKQIKDKLYNFSRRYKKNVKNKPNLLLYLYLVFHFLHQPYPIRSCNKNHYSPYMLSYKENSTAPTTLSTIAGNASAAPSCNSFEGIQ